MNNCYSLAKTFQTLPIAFRTQTKLLNMLISSPPTHCPETTIPSAPPVCHISRLWAFTPAILSAQIASLRPPYLLYFNEVIHFHSLFIFILALPRKSSLSLLKLSCLDFTWDLLAPDLHHHSSLSTELWLLICLSLLSIQLGHRLLRCRNDSNLTHHYAGPISHHRPWHLVCNKYYCLILSKLTKLIWTAWRADGIALIFLHGFSWEEGPTDMFIGSEREVDTLVQFLHLTTIQPSLWLKITWVTAIILFFSFRTQFSIQ